MKRVWLALCLMMGAACMATAQNVTGRVTCDGQGVAGVAVSDGVEVVTTDADGYYSFTSDKKNGYVFYTVPRGYEPEALNGYNPQFWAKLTAGTGTTETHDFAMKRVDNDRYLMLVGADTHLANRTKDLKQFSDFFVRRVRQEKQAAGNTPIYSTILGDLAWDVFWYQNNYDLSDFMKTLSTENYPLLMWPVMGNHDNNGAAPATDSTDFVASAPFRSIVCPNYYSYNIGKIHYVVLDDVFYKNTDTGKKYRKGIAGSRDYDQYITDAQFLWLEKDLALVDEGTTVVVEMHIPATKLNGKFQASPRLTDRNVNSTLRLYDLLKPYRKALVLTGHTHYNFHTELEAYPNIHEHNVAAVCGTWWFTGKYTGRQMCKDGTPSGYELMTVDDDSISWEYHSLEQNGNAQFRAYDMNVVRNFYRTDKVMRGMFKNYPERWDYSTSDWDEYENAVVLNVFNFADDWKIEAVEAGKPLEVKRILLEDPLHTLSYDRAAAEKSSDRRINANFGSNRTAHAFLVRSDTATGTIEVRVTDSFGHVYTKSVTRPGEFSLTMHDQTARVK